MAVMRARVPPGPRGPCSSSTTSCVIGWGLVGLGLAFESCIFIRPVVSCPVGSDQMAIVVAMACFSRESPDFSRGSTAQQPDILGCKFAATGTAVAVSAMHAADVRSATQYKQLRQSHFCMQKSRANNCGEVQLASKNDLLRCGESSVKQMTQLFGSSLVYTEEETAERRLSGEGEIARSHGVRVSRPGTSRSNIERTGGNDDRMSFVSKRTRLRKQRHILHARKKPTTVCTQASHGMFFESIIFKKRRFPAHVLKKRGDMQTSEV